MSGGCASSEYADARAMARQITGDLDAVVFQSLGVTTAEVSGRLSRRSPAGPILIGRRRTT